MNLMKSKTKKIFFQFQEVFFLSLRLKRRLEQYEHDRQIERAQVNRLQAKREVDIEARLRKDRVCS